MRAFASRLPMVSQDNLPSPAYQQYVLGQLATGGFDPVTGTTSSAAARGDSVLSQTMFSLLPAPAGRQWRLRSCPLDASGNVLAGRPAGTPARRQRLRNQQQRIAEQQRQREPDRGQDRSHHQRQTQSGTASSRTRACRRNGPILSTPSSTPFRRSRSARWLWATRTFSARSW
jgi:hypothetical protein